MINPANFRDYHPEQLLLLPPDMREWLPEDHLAYFICDVVKTLDLKPIYGSYNGTLGGQPAYHPQMMVSLLLYAYCVGIPSSRQIEKNTYESLPFRVITADQHPDHDTIADFRNRHLKALAELFVEILQICRKAKLVKLGHVALDGTKVRANASKHKAMSYGRMHKKIEELEAEVAELLAEAQRVDAEEDARYGKGRRGDELPDELKFKQSRLEKIREAKAELEAEAKAEAERKRAENAAKEKERRRGPKPKHPPEVPPDKAQRNFTDPDSRIMKDGATKSFEQCYNAQAAVDSKTQIVVAARVTNEANDKQQLKPMVEQIQKNTEGENPKALSADSGYFSAENANHLGGEEIDGYVAVGRRKHSEKPLSAPRGRIPKGISVKERMERKLRTVRGRGTYKKRKQIVEPVFGQIKEARGFRRFSLRGLEQVDAEWHLICLTHNLLKLFRSGWSAVGA
jgi:transposase